MALAVTSTTLGNHLPLIASGKVREIYAYGPDHLLLVTTDRISAYDVVMQNAVAHKGEVLTMLSEFWFRLFRDAIPGLRTHFVSVGVPQSLQSKLSPDDLVTLSHRTMCVRKFTIFKIESIVRGYITGSAWSSYKKDGTVNGIKLPTGLQESQKLPKPLWTPSTKAEQGEHDENISPDLAAIEIDKDFPGHGQEYADRIRQLSIDIYNKANNYAAKRGIILADTKFEFGLDTSADPPAVILVDEVLTPDSSRFWPADKYQIGQSQESYDKQYLRDWLVKTGQKGKEGVEMPADIARNTAQRYLEAFHTLTGKSFDAAVSP